MTNRVEESTPKKLSLQLKQKRKESGLSLQALSDLSGVSVSMISRTERGEVTPSTTVLSKLVNALGLSFAGLMGPESSGDVVVIRANEQPVLEDKHNHISRTCLSPILPGRGIDVVKMHLDGLSCTGELVGHTLPVGEYIYVLSGQVDITLGETVHRLQQGDSMYYMATVRHSFCNPAPQTCEMIVVIDGKNAQ